MTVGGKLIRCKKVSERKVMRRTPYELIRLENVSSYFL